MQAELLADLFDEQGCRGIIVDGDPGCSFSTGEVDRTDEDSHSIQVKPYNKPNSTIYLSFR